MKSRVLRLEGGAFSPIAAFLVLLTVVAGGAIFILTRPDPVQPRSTATPHGSASSPDHSLTDAEAIARLAHLDRLRIQSLEKRDVDLLRKAVVPGSPAAARLRKSIHTLLNDRVRLNHRRYDVLKSRVTRNQNVEIRIQQTVVVDVQFRDADGERITQGTGVEKQVLVAVLRPVGGEWLFFDGEIVKAESVTV